MNNSTVHLADVHLGKSVDISVHHVSNSSLNNDAQPFIPSSQGRVRGVSDVLKDHSEVEKVVLGGAGTLSAGEGVWSSKEVGMPPSSSSLSGDQTALSNLPFAQADEVPPSFLVPAKPVARTNHLKEIKISFNDGMFIDRVLPDSNKALTPHPRFTPTYYVALHNLAASTGHDGNGFWYPSNTPNYMGARIPLVHTGLNIENWRYHLTGHGEVNELLQFLQYGFPLGLEDNPVLKPCERNHGSAYQYFPHIDKFVIGEISMGGLSGPFTTPPWENLMLSPLMTAPKKPSSRRCVFDATFGDHSLNNATPGDSYLGTPTLYTYPKIDDFRRLILLCGQSSFMWKRDLHRFYLQIPMDPVDYAKVGFIWRGLIFIFVALMFGLRHSGLQGQRITDAVSWIHRRLGLEYIGEAIFNLVNYCDDLGGVESTKSRAEDSFRRLQELLNELGLDESVDKAQAPSTEMVYLGVLFNTDTMTMSVPADKLAEIKEEIERWYKKTTATKKTLQSILGKLFWISKVVQHSRTFMGRLLAQLREMSAKPDNVKTKLTEDCKKDLLWWRSFLKTYNGVTMIENDDAVRLTLPQLVDMPYSVCAGDATLTGGGAWHGSGYWSRQLPKHLCDLQIPVHVKEFLVVLVSTRLWGGEWSGKVVQIFCDNDAVCDVVSGERPSDSKMLSMLREFKYWVCTFKFYPIMRKIGTADNSVADHISRRHDDAAAQLVFQAYGLGHMTLIDAPDRLFDMTEKW